MVELKQKGSADAKFEANMHELLLDVSSLAKSVPDGVARRASASKPWPLTASERERFGRLKTHPRGS